MTSENSIEKMLKIAIVSLQEKLDKEQEEHKNLHMKDKYTVHERYQPVITKKHPYSCHPFSRSEAAYVLNFTRGSVSFMGETVYFDDLSEMKKRLEEHSIKFTVEDRSQEREFNRLLRIDKVSHIMRIGGLCMQPCTHRLKFKDETGMTFEVRYCSRDTLLSILERLNGYKIPEKYKKNENLCILHLVGENF